MRALVLLLLVAGCEADHAEGWDGTMPDGGFAPQQDAGPGPGPGVSTCYLHGFGAGHAVQAGADEAEACVVAAVEACVVAAAGGCASAECVAAGSVDCAELALLDCTGIVDECAAGVVEAASWRDEWCAEFGPAAEGCAADERADHALDLLAQDCVPDCK